MGARDLFSPGNNVRSLLLQQPKYAGVKDVRKIAKALFRGVGTQVSKALSLALERGDVDYIAGASCNPNDYQNPQDFYADYCCVSFLKKFEALAEMGHSNIDPERAAIDSFFKSEALCSETNKTFSAILDGNREVPESFYAQLDRAKAIISKALGKCPEPADLRLRFGPGATSACSGDEVTILDKLTAFPETTVEALPLLRAVESSQVWLNLLAKVHPRCLYKVGPTIINDFGDDVSCYRIAPKLVYGNRFTTVPKNAKTHRGICIEPHTLSCIQLALGACIQDALNRLGLSKAYAQKIHGRLAKEASLFGVLMTLDLSAASDTIAWYLVKYLLPEKWFNLLAMARSDATYIDGSWVRNEKFSSMGNGFTFELETLIFYALTRACSDVHGESNRLVSVFGDDIICASSIHGPLCDLLQFCGFKINLDKTFHNSSFNESCGADFFDGVDVRPYFLKGDPRYVTDWFGITNGIWKMATKHSDDLQFDDRFRGAWLASLGCIPGAFRYYGPPELGDAVIHSNDITLWRLDKSRLRVKTFERCDEFGKFKYRWELVPKTDLNTWSVIGLTPVLPYKTRDRWCEHTAHAAGLYNAISLSSGTLLDKSPANDPTKVMMRGDAVSLRTQVFRVAPPGLDNRG